MIVHLRLDEESKTPQQLAQREATYAAAKILKVAGVQCYVQEYFTGSCKGANAASIVIGARDE